MSHPLGAGFSLTVGVISFCLAVLAFAAYRRSDDRRMLFVMGAFAAFAVKGILVFINWSVTIMSHNTLEVVRSALDLAVVLLLVAPFLKR